MTTKDYVYLGLILLTAGFADVEWQVYVGAGAALAMFVVGAAVARPAWAEIRAAIENGDAPRAAAGVRPFTRALVLENLLWVLALGAMVA